ncbi:MAG: ABC transporter ATP-binding protein [Ilumatobacteraceae bacterium]
MAVDALIAAQLRDVHHRFGEVGVLRDVALTVRSGEIVAIVGPSGCGKTTLLRIVAGLLTPSGGEVARPDSGVGFVFQEPALLAWRRVDSNARLLARGDDAIVDHLLAVSGLLEHRHKWPHELSGGMKMRLSLVRSLAARPDLLLLDEPFGALDQITRHRLHDEFGALHESEGFSALLVTHSIDEAVYLADRVLVMSSAPGRIVGEFAVPFPRPRSDDLRYSSEFAALVGNVARSLYRYAGDA